MPSTPSTRLRAELQAAGENLNTWGNPKLTEAIKRLEEGIAGRVALTVSGSVTLTATNFVADQARNMFLDCTGTGGTITIPAVEKLYLVRNATSGGVVITTGGGASATLTPGLLTWVVSDATNVYLHTAVPDGVVTPAKLSTGGPVWDAAGATTVASMNVTGGLFAGAGGDVWIVKVGTQTFYKFSNSGGTYWVYDLTTGITNLYANFNNILSIDLSGTAIFKGSVIQNGTPV